MTVTKRRALVEKRPNPFVFVTKKPIRATSPNIKTDNKSHAVVSNFYSLEFLFAKVKISNWPPAIKQTPRNFFSHISYSIDAGHRPNCTEG